MIISFYCKLQGKGLKFCMFILMHTTTSHVRVFAGVVIGHDWKSCGLWLYWFDTLRSRCLFFCSWCQLSFYMLSYIELVAPILTDDLKSLSKCLFTIYAECCFINYNILHINYNIYAECCFIDYMFAFVVAKWWGGIENNVVLTRCQILAAACDILWHLENIGSLLLNLYNTIILMRHDIFFALWLKQKII